MNWSFASCWISKPDLPGSESNEPSSAVTEWLRTEPPQFQITLSPAPTVTLCGL